MNRFQPSVVPEAYKSRPGQTRRLRSTPSIVTLAGLVACGFGCRSTTPTPAMNGDTATMVRTVTRVTSANASLRNPKPANPVSPPSKPTAAEVIAESGRVVGDTIRMVSSGMGWFGGALVRGFFEEDDDHRGKFPERDAADDVFQRSVEARDRWERED